MKPLNHRRPETLHDHIKELRNRLLQTVCLALAGATVAYLLRKQLIVFLQKPLNETLYYTSPSGGFSFVMKLCLVMGLGLALPLLIYHLISFIRPAFATQVSARMVRLLTLLSLLLAVAGAAFGFWVAVPMSLHFFQSFQIANIKALIGANDYLSFVLNCIITFILIFQIPLVVLFIDRIKPLPPRKLLKYEKFVIAGSFLLALILPFTYDPITQFLLAIPIIALYNLSIFLIVIAHSFRRHHMALKRPSGPRLEPATTTMPHASLMPQLEVSKTVTEKKSPTYFDIVKRPRPVSRKPITPQRRPISTERRKFMEWQSTQFDNGLIQ